MQMCLWHTALTVFGKDSIIISYLMLNIHSIKTVSTLVVYLTVDDFRYDCNDDVQVTMNSVTD